MMHTPFALRSTLNTLLVACALLLPALPAQAQTSDEIDGPTPEPTLLMEAPGPRQGYYVGLGGGSVFNANFRTEDDNTGTLTGGASQLRLGQMVTPWLGFGLQIGGGAASADGLSTGFGGLMLDAQVVPFDHLALHVALGAGGLSLTDDSNDDGMLEGTGGGYYAVGLSYDWFPFYDGGSGGWSLTPHVQFQYMPGTIFDATIVQVGVEIVWWSGLPNNQLQYPDGEGFESR